MVRTEQSAPAIPKVAHFVWLGETFPWAYSFALLSAAKRGGFEQVILHHEDELACAGAAVLRGHEKIRLRRFAPEEVFAGAGPRASELLALYRRLSQPAARSNMLRAAILYAEGGVYLDTDTITVASFEPLLDTGFFCGEERIALPAALKRSRDPMAWVGAGARLGLREVFRALPAGHLGFTHVEKLYTAAVNNAVLGSQPGHPFVAKMLERMVTLDSRAALVRYALGTALLQDEVAAYEGNDLVVHDPERFYPLPPEISEHWFRTIAKEAVAQKLGPLAKMVRRSLPPADAREQLREVVRPSTVLVHWYASVRTKRIIPQIDPDYVRRHAATQLWSALCEPFAAEF